MSQKSKVASLPIKLLRELKKGYREGNFTVDEALDWIHSKEPYADVSRSGVYRYLSKDKEIYERIQRAEEIAAGLGRELTDKPKGNVARMCNQVFSALALSKVNQLGVDAEMPDSKELFFLSTVLKNLASAEKTALDTELRIRKEIAAELAKKVEPALKAAESGAGLSAETASAIRKAIAEVEI